MEEEMISKAETIKKFTHWLTKKANDTFSLDHNAVYNDLACEVRVAGVKGKFPWED